jgi:hypothetical protein
VLLDKINQVNELLASYGKKAVQKIQVGNKPVLYGYKPQFVIDAVNEILGPENWYFKLLNIELFNNPDEDRSGQVVASVEVFIREGIDSEFISHGIQYGQSQVVHGNAGDAKKGSITDAIQKGLSLFSIGKAAYRGELEAIFTGKTVELTSVSRSQKPATTQDTGPDIDLPELPNVKYETAPDGTIVARGDTYSHRSLLKSMGFIWLSKGKAWGLKQAA